MLPKVPLDRFIGSSVAVPFWLASGLLLGLAPIFAWSGRRTHVPPDGVLTRTASVHASAWKKLYGSFFEPRATQTGTSFVRYFREQLERHGVEPHEPAIALERTASAGGRKRGGQ